MLEIEASSNFAMLVVQPLGLLVGEMFEHYQHMLDPKEEAVLGLRCIGWTYKEIADQLLTSQFTIKQYERAGIAHMILLYRQGR